MIIRRIQPLANDHPEDLASCESSGGTGILHHLSHPCHPNQLSQDVDSISRTFLEHLPLVGILIIGVLRILNLIEIFISLLGHSIEFMLTGLWPLVHFQKLRL